MTIDFPPCPYPCTYEGHHWHTSDGTRTLCGSTNANGHRCTDPWTPDNPLGCVTTSLAAAPIQAPGDVATRPTEPPMPDRDRLAGILDWHLGPCVCTTEGSDPALCARESLIVDLRNVLDELRGRDEGDALQAADRLERIEAVRALHQPRPYAAADMRAIAPSLPAEVCGDCWGRGDSAVPWPCPTVRALDGEVE